MDSEDIKSAWRNAAIKLGVGSFLVAAVLGIRILTVTPTGVEAEIAELEPERNELDHEVPVPSPEASPEASLEARAAQPAQGEPSLVSRLGASIRERLSAPDSGARDGDKLVSCRVAGSTRFMRADDCAMRGGRATVFVDDE